jgi:hypothetical protein
VKFDYTLDFDQTDFREHPELYRVGRGEQGVLLVEPYKGEILPHWRFKTPDAARASAAKIYELYEGYAYPLLREEHKRRHKSPPRHGRQASALSNHLFTAVPCFCSRPI